MRDSGGRVGGARYCRFCSILLALPLILSSCRILLGSSRFEVGREPRGLHSRLGVALDGDCGGKSGEVSFCCSCGYRGLTPGSESDA